MLVIVENTNFISITKVTEASKVKALFYDNSKLTKMTRTSQLPLNFQLYNKQKLKSKIKNMTEIIYYSTKTKDTKIEYT